MVNGRDENEFVSPVVGVDDNAWIRPGELLVELAAERALEDRLRALGVGGERYRPSREPDERDWRQRPGAPEYGDVNARLEEGGFAVRLWVGLPHPLPVELVKEGEIRGLHLHHVFVGEDLYHGGPEGSPTATAGPVGPLPTWAGDSQPDIAVLDNGLPQGWDALHPELGLSVARHGTQNLAEDPLDENNDKRLDRYAGHGAFICGLISRMRPRLKVDLHRVLHATGEGDEALISNTLAAVAADVKVVNLSLGGYTPNNMESSLLPDAVRGLVNAGKVVVAAAGNNGDQPAYDHRPFWPAAMPEVIAVGAYSSTTGLPTPWPKSNAADICAPGVDLLSSYVRWQWDGPTFDGWAQWSGTSFAAPLVAAELAARLLAPHGTLSAQQVVDAWRQVLPAVSWPHKKKGSGTVRLYQPQKALTRWPW